MTNSSTGPSVSTFTPNEGWGGFSLIEIGGVSYIHRRGEYGSTYGGTEGNDIM